MEDIISTLLDLGHRGYVTMTEVKKDFLFARTDKPAGDLREFEQEFLEDIFEGDSERTLNSMRYEFADNLPGLRSDIYDELVNEGLVEQSPSSVRKSYGCLAMVISTIR